MKKYIFILMILASFSNLGMARHGQYDEEAREAEHLEKSRMESSKKNPAKGIAAGVKQATVDSTRNILSETAEGSKGKPVLGTLEGAQKGTALAVENAVKGTVKVATLGYKEVDDVAMEEPEAKSGEVTKFKIKW